MGQLSARTEVGSIPNWYVYVRFCVLLQHILMDIYLLTGGIVNILGGGSADYSE
jgi:hypothetical protein